MENNLSFSSLGCKLLQLKKRFNISTIIFFKFFFFYRDKIVHSRMGCEKLRLFLFLNWLFLLNIYIYIYIYIYICLGCC